MKFIICTTVFVVGALAATILVAFSAFFHQYDILKPINAANQPPII